MTLDGRARQGADRVRRRRGRAGGRGRGRRGPDGGRWARCCPWRCFRCRSRWGSATRWRASIAPALAPHPARPRARARPAGAGRRPAVGAASCRGRPAGICWDCWRTRSGTAQGLRSGAAIVPTSPASACSAAASWAAASPRRPRRPGSRPSCATSRQALLAKGQGGDPEVARQAGREGQARPGRRATPRWSGSPSPPSSATSRGCDLVIEAVTEDLAAQDRALARARRRCARRPRSSPPTPPASRSATWPRPPAGPTASSACTSSTPCRSCRWSRWCGPSPPAARRSSGRWRSSRRLGKEPIAARDRSGLRGQPAAGAVSARRGAGAGAGRGLDGRHRPRHAARLRPPDGPAHAAGLHRAGHRGPDRGDHVRRVPRAALRPAAAAPPDGGGRAHGRKSGRGFYDYSVDPPASRSILDSEETRCSATTGPACTPP